MDWLVGVAAFAVFVLVAVAAWYFWWLFPKRQVETFRPTITDPKDRADVENNFRSTISQVLGGAAVIAGAALGVWQFLLQQQAAQDLLVSNQIAKGFEELGQEQLGLKIGGLFELEGVMNNSKTYHRPILETLTLFVRTNTAGIACPPSPGGAQSPSVDIEVALTILGRRDHELDAGDGADLHGARICGADLNHTHFEGDHFNQAHLEDANLTDADLDKAQLNGAFLAGVSFRDAILAGADLSDATLNNNTLFTGADMTNTDLSNVKLSGTDITDAQVSAACGAGITLRNGELQTTRACPPDH